MRSGDFAAKVGSSWQTVVALAVTGAVLLSIAAVEPRPLAEQPFPDAQEYADGARRIADGEGYVTYVHGDEPLPPRYPPGFSLTLVPFASFGHYPANVQFGAKVIVLLYVLVVAFAAWRLGGPLAAALATAVVGMSPFAREFAGLVLSDVLVATATVLLVLFVEPMTRWRGALSAFVAAASVVIRFAAATNVIALFASLRRKVGKWAILAAALPLAALVAFQWATLGSPFTTGYSYWGLNENSFSFGYATAAPAEGDGLSVANDLLDGRLMSWVCPCVVGGPQVSLPNVVFYPFVLAGLFWLFSPPFFTIPGLVYAWRSRSEVVPRLALSLTALNLLLFIFYRYQGARFVAGPATLLVILSSVALVRWATVSDRGRARDARSIVARSLLGRHALALMAIVAVSGLAVVAALALRADPIPRIEAQRDGAVTTLEWSTGSAAAGSLYVSKGGAREALVAVGAHGSVPVRWMVRGIRYRFRLYAGSSKAVRLASLNVYTPPGG